jgi:hypothetical protein
MAIDVRANVTCNIGTLISGSISDSYIQGSGLVTCSGSIELSGLYAPAIGDPVTFSYTKDGITRQIPRKLRVLSSFADPFRQTTKIELGCKLTYLSDLKPAPTVNEDSPIETGIRQQCVNGYIEYPPNSTYGTPIMAFFLMNRCLSSLDITSSSNPLSNRFFDESFDLSGGYVQVLGDLLVSESYCGYLDFNEVLQVFSLDQNGGTGPVLGVDSLIDVDKTAFGDLPGDAVVVKYTSLQLNEDLEEEDSVEFSRRNWESDKEEGSAQSITINYTTTSNLPGQRTYTYVPYTTTTTTYGQDLSFPDDVCVIAGKDGPDLSNSVIYRETRKRICLAFEAGDYCAKILSVNGDPGGSTTGEVITTEEYSYDSEGQVTQIVTTEQQPFWAWAGKLNLDFVFGNDYVELSGFTNNVTTRRTVVDIETLYANLPSFVTLDPGETLERVINGQREVTSQYLNYGLFQSGQVSVSGIRENAPFSSSSLLISYLLSISTILLLEDKTIRTSRDRVLTAGQIRPPTQIRLGGFNGENTTELVYASGSSIGTDRVIEFSMPYQDDDYYGPTGSILRGRAASKAARYGRCQNKLLLGNRYGMNIQLVPEMLPSAPFSPYFVSANGYQVLYRTNGTSWQMDSTGIIVSTDGLFWGAVGGDNVGQFWFPVAPGITSVPPAVTVIDGEATVNTTVPAWNEIVPTIATTKTKLVVTTLDYALNVLTEVIIASKTKLNATRTVDFVVPGPIDVSISTIAPRIQESLSARVPVTDISTQALIPKAEPALQIRPAVTDIVVTAQVPLVGREIGVYANPSAANIGIGAIAPSN